MLSFIKRWQVEKEAAVAGKSGIKIVIASEDAAGAARARELSERLARELRPGTEITSEVWRFNFLRHEDVRNVATASIAEAAIVVLCAHDDGELPSHVRIWIDEWVALTRTGPTALVALLDRSADTPGNSPRPGSYLGSIARRAGMDFYLKAGDGREPDFVHVVSDQQGSEPNTSAALDAVLAEASLFQSGRFMSETAAARISSYAHSTAVS
jgi:hypothetical protein